MGSKRFDGPLERVNDCLWRIPKSYKPGMRVDGLIYADDALIELIREDQAAEQVANVAFLPGIQHGQPGHARHSLGLRLLHRRRLRDRSGGRGRHLARRRGLRHQLRRAAGALEPAFGRRQARIETLVDELFRNVPTGAGRGGKYKFDHRELRQLLERGAAVLCNRGDWRPSATSSTPKPAAGWTDADPTFVSDRALDRGYDQCGTLGSGNHFLEVQVVDRVFDEPAAARAWAWRRTWSA